MDVKKFIKAPIIVLLLAGAAHAEISIDIGPSTIAQNWHTGWEVKVNQSFGDRYKVSLGYITEQSFDDGCACDHSRWNIRPQTFVGVTAWYGEGRLKFGIGPYYFGHPDRVAPSNVRVGMHFTYDLGEHWYLGVDHFSTAGSSDNLNICRDMTSWNVTDEFQANGQGRTLNTFCQSHNWNTGQDSWLRLGYRW